MTVRTRFAPSPTGHLHVGGARTALFCWLFARHHGGRFVLRIEDTDRERSTQESVDAILHSMEWLGLDWDEGPFYQSQRDDRYREAIEQLLHDGNAYRCYCSRERLEALRESQRARGEKPRYDGTCRDRAGAAVDGVEPVIRFKNPRDGSVVVDDIVRGRVVFANDELDDLVIARGDGSPTYNFTVVVDDLEMAITHVIRGDDHVNNTPRQLNILSALGGAPPRYAHLPMIVGSDGQRLSKRHGAVGVMQFRDDGILADALVNYLVRLGWSHGDQEIFSRDELVRLFDLAAVNRAAAAFDTEKLLWLNGHYIKEAAAAALAPALGDQLLRLGLDPDAGPPLDEAVEVQRDRAKTLVEMAHKSEFAYRDELALDEGAARKHLRPVALDGLEAVRERLAGPGAWDAATIHARVTETAESLGLKMGKLAQPLRVAVTGSAASPSIEKTLMLAGRERTLARLDVAIGYIRERAASS